MVINGNMKNKGIENKIMEELIKENVKILDYYGIDEQSVIWIEEMSELTKEITKRLRKGCFTSESLEHFREEITDVQICLDQMKSAINYNYEEQKESRKNKRKEIKCKIIL